MNLIAFALRHLWASKLGDVLSPVVIGLLGGAALMFPVWAPTWRPNHTAQPKPHEMPMNIAVRTWWLNVAGNKPPGSIESVIVFAGGVDVMRKAAPDSEAFTMHVIDEVLIHSRTTDFRKEPQSVTIRCHELKDESKVKIFRFRRAEKGVASFTEVAVDGSESDPIRLNDLSMAFD